MHLPDALRCHGNRVVAGVRVSEWSQVGNGSLARQERNAIGDIRAAGGRLVGIVGNDRAERGKLSDGRPELERGIAMAARLGAVLCYPNMSRLVRPKSFSAKDNPWAWWTAEDVERLLGMAGDVPLATILPPTLSPHEVHRLETTRGARNAKAEGRRAGPRRVVEKLPRRAVEAILSLRQSGESRGAVARILRLPESKVRAVLEHAQHVSVTPQMGSPAGTG